MAALNVTVITGMSGAGRSVAADVLEDLGYFVIDNLPPTLIPKVTELARGRDDDGRYALVVDVRSGSFTEELIAALAELREQGIPTRVLFLDVGDEVLVRRFEETRRRHPLAASGRVSEGLALERGLLDELKGQADLVIDTSNLNVHELRDRLLDRFGDGNEVGALQTSIVSFGYKHGLPLDVDLVFDCRFLPNPHWIESLRPRPGTDEAVRRYVLEQPAAQAFLTQLESLFELLVPAFVNEGKAYLTIGVGCTGGRHRSVVIAGEIAAMFDRLGMSARVQHRDLERG